MAKHGVCIRVLDVVLAAIAAGTVTGLWTIAIATEDSSCSLSVCKYGRDSNTVFRGKRVRTTLPRPTHAHVPAWVHSDGAAIPVADRWHQIEEASASGGGGVGWRPGEALPQVCLRTVTGSDS